MAYSDYGGYAYRNGVRVVERSDAVLTPQGVQSTPGMWPGWLIEAGRAGGSWHVLLGDGPIFLGLYKQSTFSIHRLGERLDETALIAVPEEGAVEEYAGRRHVNNDLFRESERPCVLRVDGHEIAVYWTREDNYYIYARLVQPDGTVWMGWSGYGVGAGLEDSEEDEGFSSEERTSTLLRLLDEGRLSTSASVS